MAVALENVGLLLTVVYGYSRMFKNNEHREVKKIVALALGIVR